MSILQRWFRHRTQNLTHLFAWMLKQVVPTMTLATSMTASSKKLSGG